MMRVKGGVSLVLIVYGALVILAGGVGWAQVPVEECRLAELEDALDRLTAAGDELVDFIEDPPLALELYDRVSAASDALWGDAGVYAGAAELCPGLLPAFAVMQRWMMEYMLAHIVLMDVDLPAGAGMSGDARRLVWQAILRDMETTAEDLKAALIDLGSDIE